MLINDLTGVMMQEQIKLLKNQFNRLMSLLAMLKILSESKILPIFGWVLGIGLGYILYAYQYVENLFAILAIVLFISVLLGSLLKVLVRIWTRKCVYSFLDCVCNLKIAHLRSDLEALKLYNQDKDSINHDWGNEFLTNVFEIICIESKIESLKNFGLPSTDYPKYTLESYVAEQNLDNHKLVELLKYLDHLNRFIKHKYPRIDRVEYLETLYVDKKLLSLLDYLLKLMGTLSLLESFISEEYIAPQIKQYESKKELLTAIPIEELETYVGALEERVEFYNTTFSLMKQFQPD